MEKFTFPDLPIYSSIKPLGKVFGTPKKQPMCKLGLYEINHRSPSYNKLYNPKYLIKDITLKNHVFDLEDQKTYKPVINKRGDVLGFYKDSTNDKFYLFLKKELPDEFGASSSSELKADIICGRIAYEFCKINGLMPKNTEQVSMDAFDEIENMGYPLVGKPDISIRLDKTTKEFQIKHAQYCDESTKVFLQYNSNRINVYKLKDTIETEIKSGVFQTFMIPPKRTSIDVSFNAKIYDLQKTPVETELKEERVVEANLFDFKHKEKLDKGERNVFELTNENCKEIRKLEKVFEFVL